MKAFVVDSYGKDGLQALYEKGALRPMLDRTFPFDDTIDAMAYVEAGRAKGKVVVVMPSPDDKKRESRG
jgi:NADPH:quinone reductase-like Zn-dependent oxidoreductase